MLVAVACDGLHISSHAAQPESFLCYTVDKGVITSCNNLPNLTSSASECTDLLIDLGFDVVLTGDIDDEMKQELADADIEVVSGLSGSPRSAIDSYLALTLFDAKPSCLREASDKEVAFEDDTDAAFAQLEDKFRFIV